MLKFDGRRLSDGGTPDQLACYWPPSPQSGPSPLVANCGEKANTADYSTFSSAHGTKYTFRINTELGACAMNTLEELLSIVERYRSESNRSFPNGARLVCPVPWIAPSAWLHHIMAPCPEEAIERLAPTTGRQPPAVVIEFLRMANGIRLFNGSISVLWGPRGFFSKARNSACVTIRHSVPHTRLVHLFGSDDFLVGSI